MNTENKNLIPRSPIVVIMGHIDHGKTTLLDFIRKTKVAEKESGGITQHIGAYEIELDKGKVKRKITFLDTPGHEAFSKIRERGAKIADVAVLVVAADDGMKEQTYETLDAIKNADIPFVVAINKIDKEGANPERIKKQLSEKEVYLEEWGGKTPAVEISAKTGQGVDNLLEMILLLSDMEEFKTDPNAPASGYIAEAHVDKKRGVSATLVIQNGKLKQGMHVVASDACAPVRIFENFLGKSIKEASAPSPVQITGFNKLPAAGSEFQTFENKKEAEVAIEKFISASAGKINKDLGPKIQGEHDVSIVALVLKSDAGGSAEALEKIAQKLGSDKTTIKILRSDVGDINEDDVRLVSSAGENALIIGFRVKQETAAAALSERFTVPVKIFDIIYEAEDWLKEEIKKREPLEMKEETVGKAKLLKIFKNDKTKKIVGGEVISGKIFLNANIKIYRRDFFLGEGKITELQQNKNKADEVKEGLQFGALIQTKANIAEKDIFEIIEKIQI
ncbi:MAG: translation initiation factor IF-2 [Candidatus Pacebacteria bacterium]|nr:translation initiation factor IF-2 [Candidatus Paceibacterota bacterium]